MIKNNRQNTRQIINYTFLYVEKNSKYESDAISYIKYLIKANNSKISDIETKALLNDVKTKLSDKIIYITWDVIPVIYDAEKKTILNVQRLL